MLREMMHRRFPSLSSSTRGIIFAVCRLEGIPRYPKIARIYIPYPYPLFRNMEERRCIANLALHFWLKIGTFC
jgi:hypothetical protein